MSGTRAALVMGNLAVAALFLGTLTSDLGERVHHDVAYVALALATVASWPFLRRRRLTTLLLASFGAWSLVTGLFLVYVAPDVGFRDWMGWWHGATSASFALAFLAHWARNHPRLLGLARKAARHRRTLAVFALAWSLLLAGALATWALPERAERSRFADRHLDDLTTASAVLASALLLVVALAVTRPLARSIAERVEARDRLRGGVDASLLVATWLATLTGFPLLYFTRELRALDAYWLVVAWHVVVSLVLMGLVMSHASFNARPLASHAR